MEKIKSTDFLSESEEKSTQTATVLCPVLRHFREHVTFLSKAIIAICLFILLPVHSDYKQQSSQHDSTN
jgi:hypothetical protein